MFYNLLKIATKSLEAANLFIIEKTPLKNYAGRTMQVLGLLLYANLYENHKREFLLILLQLLPKIIVCFSLVVDAFIFCEFNYVYKTASILIIPLIERYLNYSLETFCKQNLEVLDEVLEIFDKNTGLKISAEKSLEIILLDSSHILRKTLVVRLSSSYVDRFDKSLFSYEKTLAKYEDFFANTLLPIRSFLLLYAISKYYILTTFHIILLSLYNITWCYIICYCW